MLRPVPLKDLARTSFVITVIRPYGISITLRLVRSILSVDKIVVLLILAFFKSNGMRLDALRFVRIIGVKTVLILSCSI